MHIGIPVRYLYQLPNQQTFSSASSFLENGETKTTCDPYLQKIFGLFPISKYKMLPEWKSYGYCLRVSATLMFASNSTDDQPDNDC